jgi:FkbM family methyltransferase
MPHTITIGNSQFEFSGEESDPYFKDLPIFNTGNNQLQRYVSKHVAGSSICLDIGANIGLTSVLMSHYNPNGRVYSFEPSPINLQHLRDNIQRNTSGNVEIISSAIGSADGFVNFQTPQAGANSTVIRGDASGLPYTKVPLITVDGWVAKKGVSAVDFIKIDVEGFEPEVLIGAAETITRLKPKLYMEFNSITTIFEARLSPLVFAEAIWMLFDIYTVADDGAISRLTDPRSFTYENIMSHGCIDDILMELKDGITSDQFTKFIPRTADTIVL